MSSFADLLSPERLMTIPAAVIPGTVLLYFFYKRDLNPEPRAVLIKTFLLGILVIVPLFAVLFPLYFVRIHLYGAHPVLLGAYTAFVIAAIPEECFKFLVLRVYSARSPAFDEPMDGVVYGAAASLGFATFENIEYVYAGGFGVALMRAFSAVPAHACDGALMGYFLGQARFSPGKRGYAWIGLVVAILFHGFYDWPLMWVRYDLFALHSSEVATGLFILGNALPPIVLLIEGFWVYRILKKLRASRLKTKQEVL